MNKQAWTPEPWDWGSSHDWGHDDETGGTYPRLTTDDLDRAFACVNALANVAEPAAALKAAREAIKAVLPAFIFACEVGAPSCDPEEHVVVKQLRSALALLGGGA